MKYLLVIAALLVSVGAVAKESKESGATPVTPLEESDIQRSWPSLDEWAGKNKLKEGVLSAEVLLGYEYSDLDGNGTKAANAFLTRTRVNYQSANLKGFDLRVQAQYVGPVNDHYSYPGGGNPGYDVVADPEAFRIHQAYLAYTGYDSKAILGAQEIILDNARFIGNVGWRLNAQSFNAGLLKNNSIENLTMLYAYAAGINGILGNYDNNRQYHMLNAEYKLGDSNQVSGYAYLQRNDVAAQPDKLDTFGLRAWGKNGKISHDAMLALQRDAYYGSLFGEVDINAVDVGAGVEYISGGNKNNERFQTLNGTTHKFNGWADQFLGTGGGPAGIGLRAGLVDLYGQVSVVPVEKLKLMAVYHYFNTADKTDTGFSGQYGQEIDLLAKYPVSNNFTVLAKFAYYKKGEDTAFDAPGVANFTNDETVFWLRGTLKF